jgi:hypothetical protein
MALRKAVDPVARLSPIVGGPSYRPGRKYGKTSSPIASR